MAQLAVEEMDFDDIASEDGVRNIMARSYARMGKAFSRLSKEGVGFLPAVHRYILYRQASLIERGKEQRLLTWCDGRYDKMSLVKPSESPTRSLGTILPARTPTCWPSMRLLRMTCASRLKRTRVVAKTLPYLLWQRGASMAPTPKL